MLNEQRMVTSFDGTKLSCLVKENGCSDWLIVTHGVGEHKERHSYFLKLFAQQYNILLYDLRGHGDSEGKPAYVEDFGFFSKDLQALISYLQREFHMKRYTLFGHSMGGLVVSHFLQTLAGQGLYPEKVFLSSPPVGAPGVLGPLFGHAPSGILSFLSQLPSLPISGLLDIKKLSHDLRTYQNYIADPKNHLKVHTKLFLEIMKTSRDVFSRPLRAQCPLFVSIGSLDKLVHPQMLIDYFTHIEKNAVLEIIKDGYHELHNEIEKYRLPYLDFVKKSLTRGV